MSILTHAIITRDERAILELLVVGQSDRQIAAALHVSLLSVQGQVADIGLKLGANNRTHTAALAAHAGVMP